MKWFTVVDFHTLEAMFLPLQTKKAALSLFYELGISSQDQFCLEIEADLWRKKGKQIFSKTVRASKLTWQITPAVKCDRRWLLLFWVYISRPSTRCKIWCTLGLFANYFSLKSLSLNPSKITWMCSEVNWFVEYKFIVWFKLQIY